MKAIVWDEIHVTHPSALITWQYARSLGYTFTLTEIQHRIKFCNNRQSFSAQPFKSNLEQVVVPKEPCTLVCTDFIGPLIVSRHNKWKYVLVIIDALTRKVMLKGSCTNKANLVVQHFQE